MDRILGRRPRAVAVGHRRRTTRRRARRTCPARTTPGPGMDPIATVTAIRSRRGNASAATPCSASSAWAAWGRSALRM